jgi:hypothetical protein
MTIESILVAPDEQPDPDESTARTAHVAIRILFIVLYLTG